jgi:hypothetical protein
MTAGGKNRAAGQLFRCRGRCPGGLCAGQGALFRDQAATSMDDLQPAEEHAHKNGGETSQRKRLASFETGLQMSSN